MRYQFCWIVAFWGLILEGVSADAIPGIPLDLSAILGSVTVEQEQRQRYNIQPRIRMGDLSAAFDLEIFLDHEGRIRDSGWDFSSRRRGVESLLRKIHYVRYGDIDDRNRRLSLHVGALEWVTLGTGLVMRNYRNTHGSPGIKRAGLDMRIRHIFRRLTVRTLIGNLLDLESGGPVFGGRAEFQPVPLLDMGVTAVVDADQLSGLPDSIRAGLPRDTFAAASVDVGYPFIDRRHLRARLYAAAGRILDEDSGTGLALPGVMVDVGPARLQAEYRWVSGRFQPGHFDALYDVNRALVDPRTGAITTREATLRSESMQGVFGSFLVRFYGIFVASGSYQHLRGDAGGAQIVEGRADMIPEFLKQMPKIKKVTRAEGYFEKRFRNISLKSLFDGTPNTRFGYVVALEPVKNTVVIMEAEFTYLPDGTGGFKRERILNIQTKIEL